MRLKLVVDGPEDVFRMFMGRANPSFYAGWLPSRWNQPGFSQWGCDDEGWDWKHTDRTLTWECGGAPTIAMEYVSGLFYELDFRLEFWEPEIPEGHADGYLRYKGGKLVESGDL